MTSRRSCAERLFAVFIDDSAIGCYVETVSAKTTPRLFAFPLVRGRKEVCASCSDAVPRRRSDPLYEVVHTECGWGSFTCAMRHAGHNRDICCGGGFGDNSVLATGLCRACVESRYPEGAEQTVWFESNVAKERSW
jgi:hypothetical protein